MAERTNGSGPEFGAESAVLLDDLRPNAAALLDYLRGHEGEVVGKDVLMDALWPATTVTENSLYQAVSELRRALKDHPEFALQTVPRRGYRLVRRGETRANANAALRRRPVRLALAALCAVIVLMAAAAWLWPRPAAVSTPPSIAILPFDAPDDDLKWVRLGAGLSAEIAGVLARNSWLHVAAPVSAEAARHLPSDDVAGHLGVRFVLDGRLQVEGDTLRVTATLRDESTARVLWSERWQRPVSQLFDVQDEIVDAIDAQFSSIYSGTLAEYGKAQARRRPTSDLDAFENFLLGSDEKHRFTAQAYENALVYLRRAVALDPDYAQAWITLALVLGFQADISSPEAAAGLRGQQLATALKAYALDPDDPSVNWGMALAVTMARGDRARGERHLRRALDLAPNDADVLLIAGWIAPTVGIFGPEPLAWADRAAVLNPSAPAWHAIGHGVAAFASGDFDRSLEILAQAPESVETLLCRALALVQLGRMDQARRARDALMTLAPDFALESLHGAIPPGSDTMLALTEPARRVDIPVRLDEVAGGLSPQPANAAASSDRRP
ncbi:winged helix-turn-helix domain-containing protein [Aestuariicoccus sp. KMU-90]|uniref:Winged helix-turn-helix domain-containing protein n=1 Tax=Thetidibacter halocola TaxID=2827239 RepID=A0A8J8B6Q2_9RHOB|nr:winged helix-turn-helix domain-containing protein [Thetidibacter halocola]